MKNVQKDLYHSLQGACLESSVSATENDHLDVRGIFRFAEEFIGFDGHFPGTPVVPAIVQLAAVRSLVELALKRQMQPVHYKRTKFRGMVQPNEKVVVQLRLREQAGSWNVAFSMRKMEGDAVADGVCEFSAVS